MFQEVSWCFCAIINFYKSRYDMGQACWHIPVTPALRRLREEDLKFEASLCYVETHCLKKKSKAKQNTKQNQKKKNDMGYNLHCLFKGSSSLQTIPTLAHGNNSTPRNIYTGNNSKEGRRIHTYQRFVVILLQNHLQQRKLETSRCTAAGEMVK